MQIMHPFCDTCMDGVRLGVRECKGRQRVSGLLSVVIPHVHVPLHPCQKKVGGECKGGQKVAEKWHPSP